MVFIANIVNPVISLWCFILIITVIASWLVGFGVVNPRNELIGGILRTCHALTEPVLSQIRRVIPPIGGIDLTPIVALIGARAVQAGLNAYLFNPAIRAGL